MDGCAHPLFESQVRVTHCTPVGTGSYEQVALRVRCATCKSEMVFADLPVASLQLYRAVAVAPGGTEVYLAGQVAGVQAQPEATWTATALSDTPEPL